MRIAIIVEGESDIAVYRVLIRKVRNDADDIPATDCRGKVKTKFIQFLKVFQSNKARSINKAFVICDSDCSDSLTVERKLQQFLQTSTYDPEFPVHFYATKCMLEALILADEEAINTVALRRGSSKTVRPITTNLEQEKDAKGLLVKVLSQVDLPANPRVYGEIAEAADLQRIAQRCPYFRVFVERVRAC